MKGKMNTFQEFKKVHPKSIGRPSLKAVYKKVEISKISFFNNCEKAIKVKKIVKLKTFNVLIL